MILGLRDLVLRRSGTSTWGTDGRPTSTTTDTTFQGSWQPLNGKELALLSEGERASDRRKCYTTTALDTANQHTSTPADLVSPDGGTTWYKVVKVGDYGSGAPIPHHRVELVREREA